MISDIDREINKTVDRIKTNGVNDENGIPRLKNFKTVINVLYVLTGFAFGFFVASLLLTAYIFSLQMIWFLTIKFMFIIITSAIAVVSCITCIVCCIIIMKLNIAKDQWNLT